MSPRVNFEVARASIYSSVHGYHHGTKLAHYIYQYSGIMIERGLAAQIAQRT